MYQAKQEYADKIQLKFHSTWLIKTKVWFTDITWKILIYLFLRLSGSVVAEILNYICFSYQLLGEHSILAFSIPFSAIKC